MKMQRLDKRREEESRVESVGKEIKRLFKKNVLQQ